MPVSKKRKKDGKPVHRHAPDHPVEPAGAEEGAHGPEGKPEAKPLRAGRPSNPFVTQQQAKRGSQRGR